MQMPVQRLRNALGLAWSVLVWMVLVTLWSAAAIIPIIVKVADGARSPSAAGVLVLGLVGAVGVIEAMRRLRAPADVVAAAPNL